MKLSIYNVYVSEEVQEVWDGNWYDEYFGHIVIAENEQEALDMACERGIMVPKDKLTVEEVIPKEKGIVSSDFNAG